MIDVIAVNFHGSQDLKLLSKSLLAQDFGNWRLVVVDNSQSASESERLSDIAALDPRISVLSASRNLGYLNGANWAREPSSAATWTIVTNTDVTFSSGALSQLAATQEAGIGIIAPHIASADSGRPQNPYMMVRPTPQAMRRREKQFRYISMARLVVVGAHLKAKFTPRLLLPSADTHEQQVYAAHGSCFAVSGEFFKRGGTLRHPVLLFGEELNLAEQCKRLGLEIRYVPRIRVVHREHARTGVFRSRSILEVQRDASRYLAELYDDSTK